MSYDKSLTTNLEDKYQFNGIDYVGDFGLDWSMASYRSLDASYGNWGGVDPKAEHDLASSPYAVNYNNPISFNDPNGDCPICPAIPFIVAGLVGGTSNVVNQALKGNIGNIWQGIGYFGTGAASGIADYLAPGSGRLLQPVLNKGQQSISGEFALSDLGSYSAGDWALFGLDLGTDALTGGTNSISSSLSTKWVQSLSGGNATYLVGAAHWASEPVEIIARKKVEKTTINSVASGSAANAAKGSTKLLNQFNSVESLLQNAGKFSRVKGGAQQAFVKGDGASIFKAISQGGTRQANGTILMKDGTTLFNHFSSKTGAYTLDINRAGQIFKLRITP